jgi:ubiquinol-cytochrome c reductase cytochrome b subunit
MLGGPIINGSTLTRFFALHVFILPGTLLAFTSLHVWMVLKLGINEWPMPGRIVRRETYVTEYDELAHTDGIPFVPGAVWKDLVFSAAVLFAVAVCAAVFGPYGPKGIPDPAIINTVPKPDFFFLWIYTILSYLPPQLETPFILIVPVMGVAILVALPLVAGIVVESWWRRPAGKAVPELPLEREAGRAAWAGARRCGDAPHGGSNDPPGLAGRRQHASVWGRAIAR